MKLARSPNLAIVLLLVPLIFIAWPLKAEDGLLRSWLKKRAEQRAQTGSTETPTAIDAKLSRPGDYTFTLLHNGLKRKYRVHVPTHYDTKTPAALVVALHGGGGNMDYQAQHYGLIEKSDSAGFVVVFPNGYSKLKSGQFATWNAGNCCGSARDEKIDDVGFIREVVARLRRQLNIDAQRIYATGMSNGGMMAYRLACEASDVFKAVAAVAGTDNSMNCTPKNPVSILHIHAKDDDHVLFNGGAGPGAADKSKVTDFVSVPDTISKWRSLDACIPHTPRKVLEKPGAYCEQYAPCQDHSRVQLCVTESGGHSWPGSQSIRNKSPSQAISANDLMWDFFNQR